MKRWRAFPERDFLHKSDEKWPKILDFALWVGYINGKEINNSHFTGDAGWVFFMKEKMIDAKSLREKAELTIESKPGIYKWWAEKSELKSILDVFGIQLKDVENEIEQKGGLYCIYVGQAKSLEDRLKGNHVNGRQKSTLRKSVGAIFAKKYGTKSIENKLNDFIDKLKIEYRLVSVEKLDDEERKEIGHKFLRILNGQHNAHPLRKAFDISNVLTRLRKDFEK